MLFGLVVDRRAVREEPASDTATSVFELPERRREGEGFESVAVPFDDVDDLFRRLTSEVGTVLTDAASDCSV
jgi:hypothetical protein